MRSWSNHFFTENVCFLWEFLKSNSFSSPVFGHHPILFAGWYSPSDSVNNSSTYILFLCFWWNRNAHSKSHFHNSPRINHIQTWYLKKWERENGIETSDIHVYRVNEKEAKKRGLKNIEPENLLNFRNTFFTILKRIQFFVENVLTKPKKNYIFL